MLERAITEMVTVPSKMADTSEPLRVTMMPVVLNVSGPGRWGGRRGRNQHWNPVGPRLSSSEGSRYRGETPRAALGVALGYLLWWPRAKLTGHPLLPGD